MTITYGDIGIYSEQGYTYNGDLIGTSKSDSQMNLDLVVRFPSGALRKIK